MPASVSARIAASRPSGRLVRGSSTRASSGSSVVIERNTPAALCRARSPRRSMSRVTSRFLVTIETAWRNSAITSRQPPRQPEPPLDGLIRVGDAAEGEHPRLPPRRHQLPPQELGHVVLDEDLGLEIQARRVAQELMGRPRIAINAAVFTAAVRIDADLEADVGAVVPGDDAPRPVGDELGRRPAQAVEIVVVVLDLLELEQVVAALESVGRVERRPSPFPGETIAAAHGSPRFARGQEMIRRTAPGGPHRERYSSGGI